MKTKINRNNSRLQELEAQFQSLENQIQDTAVKKAISVLHALFQESRRSHATRMNSTGSANGLTLGDIAALYLHAPKMEGPAKNKPLSAGTMAPEFKLPDANGDLVSLSDFKGKRVLLVFYPLDWSPGCSQQLDLYQQEVAEFEKRGVQIIGVSVDSIYSHGAWAAVRGIKFPLLSDFNPKGEVAKKYQVFRDEDGFTERALYLIDENGMIQYSYVSPFLHHVPDIYALYKKIDAVNKQLY
jgi:peroxiredoxin